MPWLHAFDMDGTLLPGTTACMELAKVTGKCDELSALEARFRHENLSTLDFAHAIHVLFADLTYVDVTTAFEQAPKLAGISEVFTDIRSRGERCMVITMSPDFFADRLQGVGPCEVRASRFPAVPFRRSLREEEILSPYDKPAIVADGLRRCGLAPARAVAYGDGTSDEPLFASVAHSVGINADPGLAALATLNYQGTDLRGAYALARTLLDGQDP